ncbi:NlpC/P60 family protein [Kitasatospora sp. NPDC002040]|uniref:C40 family peptidase n=1 Tax=Kitasatospora sp. NPDC002040 TaxID=3154661 RepID=UPI00331E03B2
MSTHSRSPLPGARRFTRALVLTAAATTVLGLAATGTAGAAPGAPAEPPTRKDVKAQVDQLYEEAEQASEKFNAAMEQQRQLQADTGSLQSQVAVAQEELTQLRSGLGSVAAAQYRAGGIDPAVQLMLDSDPDAYLTRARTLEQTTERQSDTLRHVIDRQRRLDQQRAETTAKLAELESVRRTLDEGKQEIRQRLVKAQRLLNTLGAGERARMADDDARDAAKRAARGGERLDLGNLPAASGRAAAALAAASSKIGSPYVYGSTGPRTFDCSGLMYWAWRQAGVTLPRTSQQQAGAGQRISLAEARPGDLVIFYRDMHHVGMYAGGGVVVHAPYPGARVRYESVNAMPVTGVVRV